MPKDSSKKRQDIVVAVAEHLRSEGFSNSGLRALAAAAGISDRMLMYYFDTKDEVIAEALLLLGDGLVAGLDQVLPAERASAKQITEALIASGKHELAKPVLMLWFEIVGLAMRGEEPYRSAATTILAGWEKWIIQKLGPGRAHLAPAVLGQIEGELMVSLIRNA